MKRIIILILCLLFVGNKLFAQVAVIANKSVPVDTITSSQLLDFYTGDIRQWGEGIPVVVFDLKPKGKVKDMFYKFLGKTTSRMKSIWLKNMLSGEGDPPKAMESENDMLKKVASTPGAIGFIDKSKLNNEVKTLVIIEEEQSN